VRCFHTNADHLMPGDTFEPWVSDDVAVIRSVARCEQYRCLDCEAWLSLGEANDEGPHAAAVAVEVRAAAHAAFYRDNNHRPGFDRFGSCPDGGDSLCDVCEVLYLAAAIATHDEGGAE
jgi:hypothetical protein